MTIDQSTTSTTWWIAHNNDDILHFGCCSSGQQITTGQPFLETFDNKIDWENRITELKDPVKTDQSNFMILTSEMSEQEKEDMEYDKMGFIDHLLYTTTVDDELYDNGSYISPEQQLFRFSQNLDKRF